MSAAEPTPSAPLDLLRARLDERLAPLGLRVDAVTPLGGGACQDLFRVDVSARSAAFPAPDWPRRLVLRSDAPRPLPGSIARRVEREVVSVAAAAGVKTPGPLLAVDGVVAPHAGAWLMELVEGEALGRRVVSHPSLASARKTLVADIAREAAKLHTVVPAAHPALVTLLGPPPTDPLAAAIDGLRVMAEATGSRRPATELALAWLADQAKRLGPASGGDVVLCHGDLRVGNLLVRPDGLAALLDWEFARWSAPAEDLAWFCVRDWRFQSVKLAAGGVGTRAQLLEAYREASGRTIGTDELRAWEVLGNVRWALGCLEQGRRYTSGERTDLELLAAARRAPEIEHEALRLIDEADRAPAHLRRGAP